MCSQLNYFDGESERTGGFRDSEFESGNDNIRNTTTKMRGKKEGVGEGGRGRENGKKKWGKRWNVKSFPIVCCLPASPAKQQPQQFHLISKWQGHMLK